MLALRYRILVLTTSFYTVPTTFSCRRVSEYKDHEGSTLMQKLLNRGAKKRTKWHHSHLADPMEHIIAQQTTGKRVTEAQRIRAKQLSHVLYDKITQIVNTGELSEELLNKQVMITSVKMLEDFGGINVYWDSNRTDAGEIEPVLQAHARKLRSLLISYHVLGRIPPVTFVKSKSVVDLTLLNQLFEVADYGPDYVPSDPHKLAQVHTVGGHLSRWDNHAGRPLPANEKNNTTTKCPTSVSAQGNYSSDVNIDTNNQLSETESKNINVTQELHFRDNLYGLPHDDLMKKVIAYRTKVNITETPSGTEETTAFDIKQLRSKMNKLKSLSGSTKLRQWMLERDNPDLIDNTTEKGDIVEEAVEEDFSDRSDEWQKH